MTISQYHKQMLLEQASKHGGMASDLIDPQEIDSSLTYGEAKGELFQKLHISDAMPPSQDYEQHLAEQQEQQLKRYTANRQKKNSSKAMAIWKDAKPYRRHPKKQPYRRLKLSKFRKGYSLNLDAVCRRLPDLTILSLQKLSNSSLHA